MNTTSSSLHHGAVPPDAILRRRRSPIRRRPALQGITDHRHFRADGRGTHEHAHIVRSEVHGHAGLGLSHIRLSWVVLRWWQR